MKKRRKIFQRAAALLCCIFLLPSLVAVPASAEDMNNFLDLVDAGYFVDRYLVTSSNPSFSIAMPVYTHLDYIDFVFTRTGTAPSSFTLISNYDKSRQTFPIVSIGNGMYRVYGTVTIHSSSNYHFEFVTTGSTYIYPFTCKVSLNTGSAFPDIGRMQVSDYYTDLADISMDRASSQAYYYFSYPPHVSDDTICDYSAGVYIDNWAKYDYIDVHLTLLDSSVSSIACSMNGSFVPFDVSVIGDVDLFTFLPRMDADNVVFAYYPNGLENYMYVNLRLDLTDIFRTDASDLGIMISGQYSTDSAYICLYSVTGYVSGGYTEADTFWIKLKNFLTDLFGNDSAADEVVQTQEQVDYEVNLQIVQAMEEWDNNIEYVETGFNSGITLVSPAVMWISSLASRVFTNMGDFGSIYLVIGLMSVTMLLLSKSGIAAKISNFVGRGSKGGGKDA